MPRSASGRAASCSKLLRSPTMSLLLASTLLLLISTAPLTAAQTTSETSAAPYRDTPAAPGFWKAWAALAKEIYTITLSMGSDSSANPSSPSPAPTPTTKETTSQVPAAGPTPKPSPSPSPKPPSPKPSPPPSPKPSPSPSPKPPPKMLLPPPKPVVQPSVVSPPPALSPSGANTGGNSPSGNSGHSGTGMSGTGLSVPSDYQLGVAFPSNPNDTYNGPQMVNPGVKSAYEVLPQLSNVVAVHLVQVPGSTAYLYMERPSGYHPDRSRQIAGTFDVVTREWVHVESPNSLFCTGHTIMADGRISIAGGHQDNAGWPAGWMSVRYFDFRNNPTNLVNVTSMTYRRWYPTLTLLPSNKIMIMGGTQGVGAGTKNNPDYEIWDPANPAQYPLPKFAVDKTYLSSVKQNYYPFNYIMPTGDMFNYCGRTGRILVPESGKYRSLELPTRQGYSTSQYPYTASSVMLALTPENWNSAVEVVIFGGANEKAASNVNMIAGRWSHRIKVSMLGNGQYVTSDWEEEDMGIPRVMGDATLLPNGDVILLNGGQRGVAGDAATGGGARASNPAFWAQLYQPDRPSGQRYTTLAASQIARLYHSVASLTTNGTVYVTGCDRCAKVESQASFYLPPPVKAEYRNEIFYPPYWYDNANKPVITAINGNTNQANIPQFGYGETFVISWAAFAGGRVPLTNVSIAAPSATTHSFNTNQRVVFLPIVRVDSNAQTVTVQTPPNPFIAIPQMYMLFPLNGKTYGPAWWIQLVDRTGAGKVINQ